MTQEDTITEEPTEALNPAHIIITEEVQKDGQLVTVERETLQTISETPEQVQSQQAYGVTHPGYVSAQDRIYTYNEATGMSESVPAVDAPETEPEVEAPEAEEDEELEDEVEPVDPAATCLHIEGSGFCQLPTGHSGAHRLNVD